MGTIGEIPKSKSKDSTLVLGGASAVSAGIGVKKLENKKTMIKKSSAREWAEGASKRLAKKRANAALPSPPPHPKKAAAEKARSSNPKAYRKQIKKQRLAKRAAKAKLGRAAGAVGVVAGAPSAIGEARSISKEGGSFKSRLGKFVERMTSMPRGSSGSGYTKSEIEESWKI